MTTTGAANSESVKSEQLRAVAASLGGGSAGTPPAEVDAGPAPTPAESRTDFRLLEPADRTKARDNPPAVRIRLGEELPIFCEKCGYALHGLPQQRCERCDILQFKCPECGHHQPINTLRPAAQRILGRIRAFFLGLWVLFKINFFGWLLFAWFAMGVEWAYTFQSYRNPSNPRNFTYQMLPRPVDIEEIVAFTLFSLGFGMFGRMLLLRWRRGWAVGAVLGVLIVLAAYCGAWFRANVIETRGQALVSPIGLEFQVLLLCAGLNVVLAAMIVWPIWMALVYLFLPSRMGAAFLDWQRSLATGAPALARQP